MYNKVTEDLLNSEYPFIRSYPLRKELSPMGARLLSARAKSNKLTEGKTMFKRRIFYSVALLIAVLVFAVGCSAVAAPAASTSSKTGSGSAQALAYQATGSTERGITVVGVGKAFGTPDVAQVTVGVETQSPSVQIAVAENKVRMDQLLDMLKELGIAEKDMRTTNYSVYSERPPIYGPETPSSAGPLTYHVSNQVTVTVRDVNKLGDVLEKAVTAGANSVYGVSFSVADTSKLEAEARANAVADAKSRAESLAGLAGVSVGEVLSISEVISSAGPLYERMAVPAAMGGTSIQPGELEVQVNVQVTYAIR